MHNAIHIPNTQRASRAIGSMFFSVFGSIWITVWSAQTFPGNWALIAAIVLGGLALLTQSVRTYRNNKPLLPDDSPQKKNKDRLFHLINGGQWVVILIVANVLINVGKPEWVLTAVILIVGLHFLPLARLFHYFPHYVMGLAMIVWALVSAWLFGPANTTGCLGTGLILWCGAVYALTVRTSVNCIVAPVQAD